MLHCRDSDDFMASSLLLLLDDIATVLDDVALMTKVAAKKTAGVLGDDLALNAQQVSGVQADRELNVVWRVAKGSLVNKIILVPLAIVISWLAPVLVTILLVIGGLFLCYEGVEKILHSLQTHQHSQSEHLAELEQQLAAADHQLEQLEQDKVKGAIRTDFILSAEIVVISLGTMAATAPLLTKFSVLALVALVMTVGVYGLVALIVKIDDLGLYLVENHSGSAAGIGRGLLWFSPFLMKLLSIVGTAAMFLVGGGIISHAVPIIHHLSAQVIAWAVQWAGLSASVVESITAMLLNFIIGAIAGSLVLLMLKLGSVVWQRCKTFLNS
jgi:predicted DNA repair protein MutK